ncbi:MAG: sodium:solute symporter family protein [Acidobacteriota bacterium]
MFALSIKFIVEPRQLSRFYALRDKRAIVRGMIVSTVAFLFVYSLLVPIGIYARHLFPTGIKDTDLIVPALLTDPSIFSAFLSSFLLVAMVAAAMSSLDSVLLVTASTCQRDIVGLWKGSRSEKHAVRETGFYVVLFAFVTTLIVLDPPGGIVKLTIFSGSLYAACFFPALVFGLYWKRGNGKAVTTSFIAGVACLLLWQPLTGGSSIHEVFPSVLISMLAYVAVAFATRPSDLPEITSYFPLKRF